MKQAVLEEMLLILKARDHQIQKSIEEGPEGIEVYLRPQLEDCRRLMRIIEKEMKR